MHVRLNPSLVFYSELTKPNISTTILLGAMRAYIAQHRITSHGTREMDPCGKDACWIPECPN